MANKSIKSSSYQLNSRAICHNGFSEIFYLLCRSLDQSRVVITQHTMQVVLFGFFSVILILNLILNGLVILVVACFKSVQPSINYLFLNLALADILVATSLIPQYIIRPFITHPDGWPGTLLCKLFMGGFTMWVAGCASTALHVIIAIERFYATRPTNQVRKIRGRKLKLIIACVWIFAILTEVPPLCVMTYDKSRASCIEKWSNPMQAKIYTVFTYLVDFATPLILMTALYSKTVAALWGRSNFDATSQAAIKSRKRVTKIAITVTVLHALCWLPDVTTYLLVYHVPGLVEYGSTLYHACVIPVGIGTCLNPFVYALQSQSFRIQMRKMIGCGSCSRMKQVHTYIHILYLNTVKNISYKLRMISSH